MSKWAWGALFVAADVLLGTALVVLLCLRDRFTRAVGEGMPLRGRWLWSFLVFLVAVAYLAMAPAFLLALIRILKR